jgi:dihydroorotate dehydrogenase electron transfer subunit
MYKSEIIKNELIITDHYRISLKLPVDRFNVQPGQFVMLKADNRIDPLLPRPFSVFYANENIIEIIYKVVGKTTRILSDLKKGDYVNILGPLGNGFKLLLKTDNRKPVLVGGGHGIAPLLFLCSKLTQAKACDYKIPKQKIIVLIGARDRELILCKDEFEKLGAMVQIATDNGSYGHKGLVTELLENELVKNKNMVVYACGPNKMLKRVSEIAEKHKVRAQVSLENIMGCGIGACLSCVCKDKYGKHKLVCSDGPVFDSRTLF